MASAFTHGIVALAAGKFFFPERMPMRFWILLVVCTILPDVDAIGFFPIADVLCARLEMYRERLCVDSGMVVVNTFTK
jgi:hypothetical protein